MLLGRNIYPSIQRIFNDKCISVAVTELVHVLEQPEHCVGTVFTTFIGVYVRTVCSNLWSREILGKHRGNLTF